MQNTTPRILAIDDDEPILELIEAYLPAYEVRKCTSGASALEIFDTYRPDLVLLDVAMPRMDGIETLRRLRGRPRGGQVHYMMLTARADPDTVNRARATGVGGYLLKPFERETLVARAGALLKREQVFSID